MRTLAVNHAATFGDGAQAVARRRVEFTLDGEHDAPVSVAPGENAPEAFINRTAAVSTLSSSRIRVSSSRGVGLRG